MSTNINRRNFINSSALLAASSLLPSCSLLSSTKLKLGMDNYSIRALKLKAPALLQYAAQQQMDAILLSDLDVFENFEQSYLQEIKAQADELNLEIYTGTGSICPTSQSFSNKHGNAKELLLKSINVATQLGSPVVRCYMGTAKDRKSTDGLKSHMEVLVNVCKSVSAEAKEAKVKIAIENHAGDMTARLLKEVIEKAGPDYVGATIDSGNATFTMEHPYKNLEILAPYILCSGIRDSIVYNDDNGVNATWKAMGEGTVDWPRYFAKWQQVCPDVPVFLEIISSITKTFPPKSDSAFWKNYTDINANDFNAFTSMTTKGDLKQIHGRQKIDRSADYMKSQLEISSSYCKETLGLGRKA